MLINRIPPPLIAALCVLAARELPAQSAPQAAAARPIPAEMTSHYNRLHPRLQPSAAQWIRGQAGAELERPSPDVAALKGAVSGRFGKSGLSAADIDAIVFMVLMEAVNNTDSDLKTQMAAMQAITAAKAATRKLLDELNQEAASLAATRTDATCKSAICGSLAHQLATIARQTESASAAAKMSKAVGSAVHTTASSSQTVSGELWNASALATTGPLTFNRLHQIQTQVGSSLKGLDEESEAQSLELQMTMDRRSKLLDTLSNIMKTIADVDEAMISNIK
jgi:hypothetical protein